MPTVKTHKPKPGFRPVHASSGNLFVGNMNLINHVADKVLSRCKHVLRSSQGLLNHVMCSGHDLVTLGHQGFLHVWFFRAPSFPLLRDAPPRLRNDFKRAMSLILNNQFIRCRLGPGKLWRVTSVAGMGLRPSGDIADLAFLRAVELTGLSIALRKAQERSGICWYHRFPDNLLFVYHPQFISLQKLLCKLRGSNGPYFGEVEEASPGGVSFFDVYLYKDICAG